LLIDSHDAPVSEAEWRLYEALVDRIGPVPTLVERDGNVPAFDALLAECGRARRVLAASARRLAPPAR
jgi:uncharacterized protein (UPF0276 family)